MIERLFENKQRQMAAASPEPQPEVKPPPVAEPPRADPDDLRATA